jgi:hypothetical protein
LQQGKIDLEFCGGFRDEGAFTIQQTEGERRETREKREKPASMFGGEGLQEGTYDSLKEDGGCTVQGNLEGSNRAEALADLEVKSLCEAAGLNDEERARDMTQRPTRGWTSKAAPRI